jgi:hypothetical protein
VQITISWPRFAQLLNQLEGTNLSDDEMSVRLASFARKAFDECYNQFGIRVGGLAAPATASIAHFNCDISGTRDHGQPFGVDYARLAGGLQFLQVIAVTIEASDWDYFCDRLFSSKMKAAHNQIADSLTNIGIDEIQPHVEQWVTHVCWKGGISTDEYANAGLPADVINEAREFDALVAMEAAGLRDPLEHVRAVDEYRRAEEEAVKAAKDKAEMEWYEKFSR